MKTPILLRSNASISSIGLLLLLITTLIGCGVLFNVNRIVKLEPVVLKEDDLPPMQVTSSYTSRGIPELSVIVAFKQQWSEGLTVRYWLFDSWYTARKEAVWVGSTIGPSLHFQPESNPEEVIGDATWYHVDWNSGEKGLPIMFSKSNVLVIVNPIGPSENLQFARNIARKIVAKIEAVLPKK